MIISTSNTPLKNFSTSHECAVLLVRGVQITLVLSQKILTIFYYLNINNCLLHPKKRRRLKIHFFISVYQVLLVLRGESLQDRQHCKDFIQVLGYQSTYVTCRVLQVISKCLNRVGPPQESLKIKPSLRQLQAQHKLQRHQLFLPDLLPPCHSETDLLGFILV